jgi:hypothetical protein
MLFDDLDIPGWGELLFFEEDGKLVPDFLVHDMHESDLFLDLALRRELWIVHSNAYIYQERADIHSEWSPIYVSDCGDEVEVSDLASLAAKVKSCWNESDGIHPVLMEL